MKLTVASAIKGSMTALLGAGVLMFGTNTLAADAAVSAAASASGPAAQHRMMGAQHDRHEHRGPGARHKAPPTAEQLAEHQQRQVRRMTQRWNLSPEQAANLNVLLTRMHEQHAPPKGAAADPHAAMSALVAGSKFDVEKAQMMAEARANALRERSPALITAAANFYDGLKPEQQTQVREFMKRGPMGGGMGHRAGGHGHHGDAGQGHGQADGQRHGHGHGEGPMPQAKGAGPTS